MWLHNSFSWELREMLTLIWHIHRFMEISFRFSKYMSWYHSSFILVDFCLLLFSSVKLLFFILCILQVMIDFQAAERQGFEEPASEIGLEPLCAMVCVHLPSSIQPYFWCLCRNYKVTVFLEFTLICRLTIICAAMILQWS